MDLAPTIITAATTAAAALGAAWPVVKPLITRTVDTRIDFEFASKLEDHKHSLQAEAENARFEFQKKLANVSLHTSRRHDAYTEAYRAARVAHGMLLNQRALKSVPTFEEYNANDLEAYLRGRDAPSGFIEEIVDMWNGQREDAIKRVRPYVIMLDQQAAENALIEAKNKTFVNELYFSDDVVSKANTFIEAANGVLLELKYPSSDYVKWAALSKQINGALEALHDAMRAELAAE